MPACKTHIIDSLWPHVSATDHRDPCFEQAPVGTEPDQALDQASKVVKEAPQKKVDARAEAKAARVRAACDFAHSSLSLHDQLAIISTVACRQPSEASPSKQ